MTAMTERVSEDSVSQGIVSEDNVKGGNGSAGSMRSESSISEGK